MAVSVALVGAGNVARVHLAALKDSPAARVAGIFDADRNRAEERAAEFGVPRVYASWHDLLADPTIDVVGVLLPHDLHREFTVAALDAGKHVVCEKPMAADVVECDAMLEAARRANRRLFVVQNRIYNHAYEAMRDLLLQEAIGTVFLAQTNGFEGPSTVSVRPWLGTERRGGGVLMAQAVHPAYALRWLLGDVAEVVSIFGGRKVVDMAAEDTAVVLLKFVSGAIGEMTATFGLRNGPFDHAIMIYGDQGSLEMTMRGGDRAHPDRLRLISPKVNGDSQPRDVVVPPTMGSAEGFRRMWEDYAQAIETGGLARVEGTDGRKAVEIILAAHQSQETGRVVKLSQ